MDEKYMQIALEEARAAAEMDEVPVGACVVKAGKVIARAHNMREASADPTAHAEIIAIREAASVLRDWRLTGATLYVTLEPCAMCTGAAINARLSRIVFGAFDNITGCCISVADMTDGWFDYSLEATGGVLEEECATLLSDYFAAKRQ
jgi:tRNA(adenine34) deaminase